MENCYQLVSLQPCVLPITSLRPVDFLFVFVFVFVCILPRSVSLKTLIDTGRGDLLSGEMGLKGQRDMSTKQKMLIQVV